jgi:hypothetical protein
LQQLGPNHHNTVRTRVAVILIAPINVAHLVKIDVERMEREVIEGVRALIERSRPFLYIENDRVEESAALISLIQDCGYRLWWHIPPLFNPDNFSTSTKTSSANLPHSTCFVYIGHLK